MLTESDARDTILALLGARARDATVCPSEVARALAEAAGVADWRGAMPVVHAAIDRLAAEGLVRLSWRGAPLLVRDGPYRIGRASEPGAGRAACERLVRPECDTCDDVTRRLRGG